MQMEIVVHTPFGAFLFCLAHLWRIQADRSLHLLPFPVEALSFGGWYRAHHLTVSITILFSSALTNHLTKVLDETRPPAPAGGPTHT